MKPGSNHRGARVSSTRMKAWQAGGLAVLLTAWTARRLAVRDARARGLRDAADYRPPRREGQTDGMLARVNSLRQEPGNVPGGASRLFLNDLNGPLYILDRTAKTFTTYLDFNGREGRKGIFPKLSYEIGYAGGFVSFQFDPEYPRNGKFYTVHIEDPALPGSNLPDNAHVPGLNVARLLRHARRTDARGHHPRRRPHRVDRHEDCERDVRRVGARGAARFAEHAHSPARRSELQPHRAPRRRRLARAVHRQRRRRVRRIALEHPDEPAAARHPRRQDPAHRPGSERAPDDEPRQRERPLPHSQRQPVRLHGRRAAGSVGARPAESASADVGDRCRRTRATPG